MVLNKKGDNQMSKKGQIAVMLPLLAFIVIIGVVILIFTMIRKPPGPSTTSPDMEYVGVPPADYIADTKSETPAPTAEEALNQILADADIPKDEAGVVTTTSNFQIEWIGGGPAGPNGFMIEIRSGDLVGAKAEAEQWLISKGFQPGDLCSGVTVSFYVASSVKKSLPPGTQFNPNPSCAGG